MANKEFQVRHGLVVNNSVFVANVITGNVGIGTSTPSSTLQVAGNANITSNLIVTGVDVVPAIDRNSITAAAAFDKANTANGVAVYAADFSNSINTIAVNAYNVANAAASGSTDLYARNTANDAYVTAQSAFNTANTALTTASAAYDNANTKLSTSGGTITGSLTISGNLVVSGNTTYVSATDLRIDDPLIYLANNNYVGDTLDIGFIANYVNATGANVHTGLYREHEDKMYYLFQGYDKEPANNHIGALSNNMTLAVLNADLRTSNLNLFGANAQAFIIASYDQANSAYTYAGAAFANANSTLVTASAAFAQANGAFINSSAGYDRANLAFTYAGAAFTNANNTLVTASAAFTEANNVNITARAAYAQSNAAFITAVAAFNAANNAVTDFSPAFNKANDAYITAQSAFDQANASNTTARSAYEQANSAYIYAGSAFTNANNTLVTASAAFAQSNSAFITASAAYVAANAAPGIANSYADVVGTSANVYATSVGAAGNTYAASVGVGANSYAAIVGTSANTYADTVGISANVYAASVGVGANSYATSVGISANTYAASVGVGANTYATAIGTSSNAYATAVGTSGNTFAASVGVGANAYATLVGTSANAYSASITGPAFDKANIANAVAVYAADFANVINVIAVNAYNTANAAASGTNDLYARDTANLSLATAQSAFTQANAAPDIANTYATAVGAAGNDYTITVGTSGNSYATSVGVGANSYAASVGTSGNAYALATATAIGTAGNSYATAVGTSGNSYATAVGTSGNTFASSVGVGANAFSVTIGASSNAWANAIVTSANNFAGRMSNSANAFANTKLSNSTGTFAGTLTITNDLNVSGNVVVANNITTNGTFTVSTDEITVGTGASNTFINATTIVVQTIMLAGSNLDQEIISGNAYATAVGAAGNARAAAIGTAGNSYATAVGTSGNAFATAVGASANAFSNTKLANTTGTLAGSLTITNDLLVDGGTLYVDSVNNEVGIGITTPTSNLHVIGTANITGSLLVLGSNVTQAIISGNAYATAVGTAGNTFAASVGVGANSFASSIVLPAFNQANTALTTAQAAYANANVSVKYNASGTFTERQVFTSNLAANTSAFSITPRAANPTSLTDGDIWINSSTSRIYYRLNSGTREFMQLDAGQVVTAKKTFTASNTQLGILALTPVASLPTSGLVAGDLAIPITSNSFQFFANNSWIRLASNTEVIAAFDAANAAPGIANSYATAVGTSGNAYASSVGVGANSYATSVGTSGNAYATAVGISGNTYAASVGVGANSYATSVGTSANAYATLVGASANAWANTKVSSSGGTITGDLSITGNLNVTGNTTFISVTDLRVGDALIYLASNNYVSDLVDIGFIGNYVNATGANVHTGLYREHEDKMYYLFQGYDKEPANNHIGALSNNMTLAVLNADIRTSNLNLGGSNAIIWIKSSYDQANAAPGIANSYATAVGTAGNSYATAVGTSGNAYALSTATSIGTAGNAYATAVGTAGNNYTISVGTSGNAYALATATAVGNAGNSYATAVGAAGNTYAASVGVGANAYAALVGTSANTWAQSYADTVGTSANVYAASVGVGANSFTITVFNTANVALNTAQAAFATANAGGGSGPAFNQANLALSTAQSAFGRANTALQNTTGTFAGELTVTGTIKALATGGDEGGEIQLANAVSNSTLSGSVVIDVYQNKLRFFEAGGTNRGAFIDLSIASTGVGSNLFAGSGSTEDATARATASAAFDKANAANVLAYSANITAVGAFAQSNSAFITASAAFDKANATTYTSNVVISVADNSNAALRINQTGTAPALVVEDNTNPDATSFVIDANGRVGVGVSTNPALTYKLDVRTSAAGVDGIQTVGTSGAILIHPTTGGGNYNPLVSANDQSIIFYGGGLSETGNLIIAPWSSSSAGVKIDSRGNVLIGRATSTVGQNVKLDVNGAINASAVLVNGTALVNSTDTLDTVIVRGNTSTNSITVGGIRVSDPDPSIYFTDTTTNVTGRIYANDQGDIEISADSASAQSSTNILFTVDGFGRMSVGGSATFFFTVGQFAANLNSSLISEYTANTGVTVDGVLIKDGLVDDVDVNNLSNTTNLALATAQSAFNTANSAGGGGGGAYSGDNGEASGSGLGDIFRVHRNVLNANVTIYSGNNSVAVGPLTIASGKTLTIQANARSVIV